MKVNKLNFYRNLFLGFFLCAGFLSSSCSEEEVLSGRAGELSVSVQGKSFPDDISVLSLENQAILCQTTTASVEIKNVGNKAITVSAVIEPADGAFKLISVFEKISIKPSASQKVLINYSPTTDLDDDKSSLLIETLETREQLEVPLIGRGTPDGAAATCCDGSLGEGKPNCNCVLEAVQDTVPFPITGVGVKSQQQVCFRNEGPKQCEINSISDIVADGNTKEKEFDFVNKPVATDDTPVIVDPSSSFCVDVSYAPEDYAPSEQDSGKFSVAEKRGKKIDITLQAKSTDKPRCQIFIEPFNSNLKCTKIDPATNKPVANPGPSCADGYLYFGQLILGTRTTKNVQVKNIGSGECTINYAKVLNLPPNLFGGFGNLPINPGFPSTKAVDVTLSNTANPQQRNIQKTIKPGEVYDIPVTVEAIAIGEFGSTSGFLNPGSIQAERFNVEIATTASDQDSFFQLNQNTPTAPGTFHVALAGEVAEADLEVVPPVIEFGKVQYDCFSEEKCVTMFNQGSADLSFTGFDVEYNGQRNPQQSSNPIRPTKIPVLPGTIKGGSSEEICFTFTPLPKPANLATEKDYSGTIYLKTSDPKQPEFPVTFTGKGTNQGDQIDDFSQLDKPMVDILFVVDNSGSMSGEQRELASNFSQFISNFTGIDYQLGVVSTEGNDCPCNETPGRLVAKANGPHIVKSTDPAAQQRFQNNVVLGTSGSATEQGLLAAKMALEEMMKADADPASTSPNKGFLRKNAKLVIITVSDEDDSSPGPVDFYTNYFKSIKGARNTTMLSYFAIVDDGSCNNSGGNSGVGSQGSRYIDVANKIDPLTSTSQKVKAICSKNWGRDLATLGANIANSLKSQFFLTRPVGNAAGMKVSVDGSAQTLCGGVCSAGNCDFEYDSSSNSVAFCTGKEPPKASKISVDYTVPCFDQTGKNVQASP